MKKPLKHCNLTTEVCTDFETKEYENYFKNCTILGLIDYIGNFKENFEDVEKKEENAGQVVVNVLLEDGKNAREVVQDMRDYLYWLIKEVEDE